MPGRLVPSSCGVEARRAEPQARRAKSEAEGAKTGNQNPVSVYIYCPNVIFKDLTSLLSFGSNKTVNALVRDANMYFRHFKL